MNYTKVPKDILPTLVIGLGGTGYQVVKRLKQLFRKRYNTDNLPVRYLLIDTDLKSFLDDNVKNNEKCQLRFGDGIKATLDWAYANPNFEWLPQNPKITPDYFTSTDQGAGLVRPIGRMYLCKNAKLVYDNLQTAKNDLVDLHKVLTDLGETYLENIDRHKVYIVGSLAGGTGCGTFLDVAVMVSKIFNRDNTNIIGMFTLESCYDDKLSSDLDAQNRSKANCYAALKELEFYMSSITNHDDEKYTFKYSNIGEIKLDRKLLDICYLLENRNEMGGVLTNIEDIYDLCSLQLFQEIGTTLGSQLRADYANFICKDKDPVLKKDRHFSTFSSSSMEFPAENLTKYCSFMFAKDILNKLRKDIDNNSEEVLNAELEKLIEDINNQLIISEICEDFTQSYKISPTIKYNDLVTTKKGNLSKADNIRQEREARWNERKITSSDVVNKILNSYVNEATVSHGIVFTSEVLNRLRARFSKDIEENIPGSLDRGTIEKQITQMNEKENKKENKKILEGKEAVPSKITNPFNAYIENVYKRVKHTVYSDRNDIIKENLRNTNDSFRELISSTASIVNEIDNYINKINHQSEKRYGGNIISRQMINKEFYHNYYVKNFYNSFIPKMNSIFTGKNLIEEVQKGASEFVELCRKEIEGTVSSEKIIEILRSDAANRGNNKYIKNELDVTSKLAKPFWSAVKNPEVSWTECYYIGCMKDETNNGFTIKAPKEVDEWIRNQTGERSRWARYVETTNPYSIDIIHITMGACAAYLPDIRNYKQFYLKLLSSKTYPLHLNEAYVGLDELDRDLNEILLRYSLAKAYGAVIEKENTSYLNIKYYENEFSYIYPSKYCLLRDDEAADMAEVTEGLNIDISVSKNKSYKILNKDIPENKTLIPQELRLGDNYHDTIKRISENLAIDSLIKKFIEDANNKFGKDILREHCIKLYVKEKVSVTSDSKAKVDFIAKQKIINGVIAN